MERNGQHISGVPNRNEFVNTQTYVNPGHFAFNEININQQYGWAIFTIAQRLENIRNDSAIVNKTMPVNSGYRNPIRNEAQPGSALNSRHIYGDAADIGRRDFNGDGNVDSLDWKRLRDVAKRLYPNVWIEDEVDTGTWVHMDWRNY